MEKRSGSKFRQTTTGAQLRRKREAAAQDRDNQRFFSRDFDHYQTQQRSNNFRRSRSTEWDKDCLDLENGQSTKCEKPLHHGPSARGDHKGQLEMPTAFHMGTANRLSMKTLDKKISDLGFDPSPMTMKTLDKKAWEICSTDIRVSHSTTGKL